MPADQVTEKRAMIDLAEELADEIENAEDEGQPAHPCARETAQGLIGSTAQFFPVRPSIYVTDDGGIAFDLRGQRNSTGLLILCRPAGTLTCISVQAGSIARAAYRSADGLPDASLTAAITSLLEP